MGRQKHKRAAQTPSRPEPAGTRGTFPPSDLARGLAVAGLQLARAKLTTGDWVAAYEFAKQSYPGHEAEAGELMAMASARQARRLALEGRFQDAQVWARRAADANPQDLAYRGSERLINEARVAALHDTGVPLFEETVGPSSGKWWELDLLGIVRGEDGSEATVPAPLILKDAAKSVVERVYAVGIYQPWHVAGPVPLFTRYIRALKPGGMTVPYAATLLRQSLVLETDWIEDVDVVVPMATSLRSYENRGFELTEELADELGLRLCLPVVDAFEIDPDARSTHYLGGYEQRAEMLAATLRLKATSSPQLRAAGAVLVVDDVLTYGSTFEACALKLREQYPQLRVYGAALAYTETPYRRALAESERVPL